MSLITPSRHTLKNGEVIVIRNPKHSDAAGFIDMMRRIATEKLYTLAEPDELEWTISSKCADIDEHNQATGFLALFVECQGILVGFLEFENGTRRRTQHAGIFSIFIRSDWRGKGVGTALIQVLLDWAIAHPVIEKITLAVFKSNLHAIALYEKFGFIVEGDCPRDMKVGNDYIDSVLMYRFVKPV